MKKEKCPKGHRECKHYATEKQYPASPGLSFCQELHLSLKDFKSCPKKAGQG
jgi:hypothetical protein